MNIFDNLKRRISNTWREQPTPEVVDLSDDSVSEHSQQSDKAAHGRSTSSEASSSRDISGSSVDHSGRSSVASTSSVSGPRSTSTPKYRGHRTLGEAMQKFHTLAVTPEQESRPAVQAVTALPKTKPFQPAMQVLPKPNSGLAPISTNDARHSRSPVYSQREQDAAKHRASLTEKIFAKKEQLKKLEVTIKLNIIYSIYGND